MRFAESCDVTGATEVAADVPGARRFERGPTDGTNALLTWHEVFPGGCATVNQLAQRGTGGAAGGDRAGRSGGRLRHPCPPGPGARRPLGRTPPARPTLISSTLPSTPTALEQIAALPGSALRERPSRAGRPSGAEPGCSRRRTALNGGGGSFCPCAPRHPVTAHVPVRGRFTNRSPLGSFAHGLRTNSASILVELIGPEVVETYPRCRAGSRSDGGNNGPLSPRRHTGRRHAERRARGMISTAAGRTRWRRDGHAARPPAGWRSDGTFGQKRAASSITGWPAWSIERSATFHLGKHEIGVQCVSSVCSAKVACRMSSEHTTAVCKPPRSSVEPKWSFPTW